MTFMPMMGVCRLLTTNVLILTLSTGHKYPRFFFKVLWHWFHFSHPKAIVSIYSLARMQKINFTAVVNTEVSTILLYEHALPSVAYDI